MNDKDELRISLVFRRGWCPPLFKDLEELGPYFRAAHVRSILKAYYTPGSFPTEATSPSIESSQGSLDDTSADEAMLQAFGPALGLTTGGQQ